MFKEKEIDLDEILDDINQKQKVVLKKLKDKIDSFTDEKRKNRLIMLSFLYTTYLSSLDYLGLKDITNEDLNTIKLMIQNEADSKNEINFIPLLSAFKNISEGKNETEKVENKMHICLLCKNLFEENKDINPQIIECKKLIHGKCFIDYIEKELYNNNFPIKCPLCSGKDAHEINYKSIKKFLLSKNKDGLEAKLDNIALEYLSLNYSDEVTYCLTPGCSYKCFYVYGVNYLNCPLCKKSYCLKCKTEWHNNLTCEEYQKKTKNLKKFGNNGQNKKKEKINSNPKTSNFQVLNKDNNKIGGLFGNIQNNFGQSLFNPNFNQENNNNQGCGLFGNNQNNKNNFGQSLFNPFVNQENNNNKCGGLFGNNQTNQNIFGESLFKPDVNQENNNNHHHQNTTSLFGNFIGNNNSFTFGNQNIKQNIFADLVNNKSEKEDNNNQINTAKFGVENTNNSYPSKSETMKLFSFGANTDNNNIFLATSNNDNKSLFGSLQTNNKTLFGAPINNNEKKNFSLFDTPNTTLFKNNVVFSKSEIDTQNNNNDKPNLFTFSLFQ